MVLALEPRKTNTFAILPLAILLTDFFFMARMAFMVALAIVTEGKLLFEGVRSLRHLSPPC